MPWRSSRPRSPPSAERLLEAQAQGAAFAGVTGAAWGPELPPAPYPVAVGSAAARHSVPVAPAVLGASLEVMERDATRMRGERPSVFTELRHGRGTAEIRDFVLRAGGLGLAV